MIKINMKLKKQMKLQLLQGRVRYSDESIKIKINVPLLLKQTILREGGQVNQLIFLKMIDNRYSVVEPNS